MQYKSYRIQRTVVVLMSLLLVAATCAAQERSAELAPLTGDSIAVYGQNDGSFALSPNALQVAQIIGVESLIARLSALASTKGPGAEPSVSLEELSLRQQITDSIVAASLDVDSVLNKIDYEMQQTVELRSILLSQRERTIGNANLAILAIGAGLGVIASTLSLTRDTSKASDAVGITAGAFSALLWIRSYRQQRGQRRPAWVLPSMLAPLFSQSDGLHSYYPDDIWSYLNRPPSGGTTQGSRREQLLAEWLAAGRIDSLDSPQSKQKIALLTSTNGADKNLHLDMLSERGAMLADVRDRVSLMKQDLRDLVKGLRPR